MEGEGMVAVVRGLRDAGLAVTLLDGNRQYTLLPNSITQPTQQRSTVNSANASTQQNAPRYTVDSGTESAVMQCDNNVQAVDGRYASTYKTMHCHVRPTSPPVVLTEFPPQRPDVYPGHGNFQVGGTGSGASYSPIRASSPFSYRGGMSWPDRGSVYSPRSSHELDAFANSLRKYPCLSPDRSSEVMERLINYTLAKGTSRTLPRNQSSPTRLPDHSSRHTFDPKGSYVARTPRCYEPEVTVHSKKVEDPPTRDKKKDDLDYTRGMRNFDVKVVRDMSKRMRETVKAISTYPYSHPVCPTIKENHDFQRFPTDHLNSSNSVNMEIQAAVKMISKEVATTQRNHFSKKSVAVPDSPTSSADEDNGEGECYFVPTLNNTSFKSIQTTFCPSNISLKVMRSAQTVCSTRDFTARERNSVAIRKSKSQDDIKMTKDDLKQSILELIEEVSTFTNRATIRDELIKKLFGTSRSDEDDCKSDSGNSMRDKSHKHVLPFRPGGCEHVEDFRELVGKLKYCYRDTKQVLRSEIKQSGISDLRQLDFVLKDWINNLNFKTKECRYVDRVEILSALEDSIKEIFKTRAKQDFDVKSAIVKIIEEIPIKVDTSYNKKSYLTKLVNVLLKRMKNVVMSQQNRRIRRKSPFNKSKILTKGDLRDFVRTSLLDFFFECNLEISNEMLNDLETELIDVIIGSIDCIRCGHINDASEEMVIIFQDLGQMTNTQANSITNVLLQDLKEMLINCSFNQNYMILRGSSVINSMNTLDNSIGSITEKDLHANLDEYTNQLCQQINEWLDSLNITRTSDRGFKDVVVNDLAGDIVDRHKYEELNPNARGTHEEELETLKYQIFKWINKLVGEQNQVTMEHAEDLLKKIKNVPAPMLTNRQNRNMNAEGQCKQQTCGKSCRNVYKKAQCKAKQGPSGSPGSRAQTILTTQSPGSPGYSQPYSPTSQGSQVPQECFGQGCQDFGPGSCGQMPLNVQSGQTHKANAPDMWSSLGKTGPNTYRQENKLNKSAPNEAVLGSNFGRDYRPNAPRRAQDQARQGSPGSHPHTIPIMQSPGSQGHPRSYSPTGQGSQGYSQPYSPTSQGSQVPHECYGQGCQVCGTVPYRQFPSNVQGGQSFNFPSAVQGYMPHGPGQGFQNVHQDSPFIQGRPGVASFGPSGIMSSPNQLQDPDQQLIGSYAFSPVFTSTPLPYNPPGGAGPTSWTTSSLGGTSDSMYSNQQSQYDPNQQSMYGTEPARMMGPQGVPISTFTGPPAPEQMMNNFKNTGVGVDSYLDGSAHTSARQLNENYDEYLKQWVQQIPMAASTPAQQQQAEKVRQSIYNGIWKSITKMKLDHDTFTNSYSYQDKFDEEIEKLLKNVPKTQALADSKPRLKAQLLEKTKVMNDQIKSNNAPASFKNQIKENIENNLPKRTTCNMDDDITQQKEEIQKLNLAEYYILYMRYKDEDALKANVHKKNFLSKLIQYLDTIKEKYCVDINTDVTANEIINSLDKVPLPNIHSIRDEADDILLGMEVENWFSDLPQEPENIAPLEERRIRDAIVKKIQKLGTTNISDDNSFATQLQEELPKYLEKMPIKKETNIDFMIDELANRINNLSKQSRLKSVSFEGPANYEEFSQNMPGSSSFTEPSYHQPSNYVSVPQAEQWYSMETTLAPPGLLNWSQRTASMQSQRYVQNTPGLMSVPESYPADYYNTNTALMHTIPGSNEGRSQAYPNIQGSSGSSRKPCCAYLGCCSKQPGQNFTDVQGIQIPYNQGQNVGPSQYGQGNPILVNQDQFGQSFPNVQGAQIPYNQGHNVGPSPYGQGRPVLGNQDQFSQSFPYVQASQTPYNQGQSAGPPRQRSPVTERQGSSKGPCCTNPACTNKDGKKKPNVQGSQTGGPFKGSPESQRSSGGPCCTNPACTNKSGKSVSNLQGSQTQNNQGQNTGPFKGSPLSESQVSSGGPCCTKPGCKNRIGQNFPDEKASQVPYNQGQSFAPFAYGQGTPGSGPEDQLGQSFPNEQATKIPYNQGQSFGPVPYGPGAPISRPLDQFGQSLGPFTYGQGAPGSGPQDQSGQSFPNQQGSQIPYNQGQSFGPFAYGQGAPVSGTQDQSGQSFPNVQGSQIPYNLGQSFGPFAYSQGAPVSRPVDQFGQSIGPLPHGQGAPVSGPQDQYGQSFPNEQASRIPYNQDQSLGPFPYSQGAPGLGPQDQYSQSFPNEQASQIPYNQGQSFGPFPYGQGAPGSGPQDQSGPSFPNERATQIPYNQGQSFGPFPHGQSAPGSGHQDKSGASFPNERATQIPYKQGQSFGPSYGQGAPVSIKQEQPDQSFPNEQASQIPDSQGQSVGPSSHVQSAPRSVPQDQSGESFPNVQGGQVPYNQGQSVGPSNVQDSPLSITQGSKQELCCTDKTCPNKPGYSLPNIKGSRVSPNQGLNFDPQQSYDYGFQGPSPAQMTQFDKVPFPYGQTSQNVQGQPSSPHARVKAQSSMKPSRQNQTSQSSGPMSSATQVPARKPNLQPMADGGMGILGISQQPGPSNQTIGAPEAKPSFYRSTDSKEHQLIHPKCRTAPEGKPIKELKTTARKPIDVDENEVFINIKSVQTAFSSVDLNTTKCNSELRSKSQEELTKTTKGQDVINKIDLQQDVMEWFESHSDKIKVELWEEKMQKLAEKLKKPGGEEKLRNKIEKFLKKVPEQFSQDEDVTMELRKQLPNDIITKLKKMYLNPPEANVSVHRVELCEYSSRFKMESFRKIIMNWIKTLHIKKKDFLGRNVKKVDVLNYVANILEPLVLDRPKSDTEYRILLKSKITEIVADLPLALSIQNKEFYINKVTENLIDDIFNIMCRIPSRYIQPTTNEIKEFVKDEATFFLEKSRIAVSTKRMEYLEKDLLELLLDVTRIVDVDNVVDDVTNILKNIGKLPEYKAKYFANLLLKDYKEFFFRESFFQEQVKSDHGRPEVFSAVHTDIGLMDPNVAINFDVYTQQLVEEINQWLSKINIPNKDKKFLEVIVKDLTNDIVDRHKYLTFNPNNKGTYAEELEHLKYQILKWTNNLVGEENKAVLEHTQELMTRITNIPKTSLPDNNEPHNTNTRSDIKPYIDKLTDEIYVWFYKLPINHASQDSSLIKQLIKDLAEVIKKGLNKKDEGTIGKEVDNWVEIVFNKKLNKHDVTQLKNRIRSIPYTKEKDPKKEKVLIRFYEDLIDDWLDTVPKEPNKEGNFINNRNDLIHELAVKICIIKTRLNQLPAEIVEDKLQESISIWLKKLPLHQQVDKQIHRDKYTAKLVKSIQEHNIDDSIDKRLIQTNEEFVADQLEEALLEWLKKLPLYRSKSMQDKKKQEAIMKELAIRINGAIIDGHLDPDKDIIELIRTLDPKQDDCFVQNTALQLKLYLKELNMFGDLSLHRDVEGNFLIDKIEIWLNNLSLDITDVSRFYNQKTDFIENMKLLRFSGSDKAVLKKKILTFMKSLPIDRNKKQDMRYLDKKASQLIQSLVAVPFGGVSRKLVISDAIKDWSNTLPLKSVHNSCELRSFIDDMSSVITTFLAHPEYNVTEANDLRLQREIVKFLRRFPLQDNFSTEDRISQMAKELVKTLNDVIFRDDNLKANNVAVYGVTLRDTNATDNDFSIRSIQETDINTNLEVYAKQLVQQIGEWMDNLNLPDVQKESFKEVVINDLAGDIVDRHKYLELNPESKGSEQDELEHLKYQIFKWINKLVGEENLETIEHADDLMKRVQGVPVPMLVRAQDIHHQPLNKSASSKNESGARKKWNAPHSGSPAAELNYSRGLRELDSSPQSTTSSRNSSRAASAFQKTPGSTPEDESLKISPRIPQSANSSRVDSSSASASLNSTECCTRDPPPPRPPAPEGTKEAIYEKYQKIFREKCYALPIDISTPENAQLAELAKSSLYNGIVKKIFNLKSDPDIENDYGYFEFMLEEKIEEMLDVLPQTHELINRRHAWKLDILANAIDMLDELHTLTDRPSFRQRVKDKFNRQFAVDLELEQCFLLQQGFLAEMADAYILQTNYKEKNPIKAKIYKHRLMNKINDLANHLTKEHNVGFRFFKTAQLTRIALKVLEQVPVPNEDVLQEEAEEIQLADEVEKWYNELPTKPFVNDTDGILRKRMAKLLAQKLYNIQKRLTAQDSLKEGMMKHEISHFLEKRAKLEQDQDLNINFMVDELNNRLKNKLLNEPAEYEAFEKGSLVSSTFAQVEKHEFFVPLMDAATSTGPMQGQVDQEPGGQASLRDQQSILQSSYARQNQDYTSQPGHLERSMGQVHQSPRTGPYGGQMGSSQGYVPTIQVPGHTGSPPRASPYANNLDMSHQGPSQRYTSHLKAPMRSMAPSPQRPSYRQAGPREGYVAQSAPIQSMSRGATPPRSFTSAQDFLSGQGPQMQGMAREATPPRSIKSGQSFVSGQGPPIQGIARGGTPPRSIKSGQNFVSGQSPPMQAMARGTTPPRSFTPVQDFVSGQGPQMQGIGHSSPNGRGPLRLSQPPPGSRQQNINQSLGNYLATNQGPQRRLFEPSNLLEPGEQGHTPFIPNVPTQEVLPTDIPGYVDSRVPTPRDGGRGGVPVEDIDRMERDYQVRCRCLEAYLKRRRLFQRDGRCPRFNPYRCPY